MKKQHVFLLALLVFILGTTGCSKPSPEAIEFEQQAQPIAQDFNALKSATDNYDHFVAQKTRWEDEAAGLSNPDAAALAKKLAVYYDMRIGVINGAAKMGANKAEGDFESLLVSLEKKHKVKLR